MPHQKPSGTPQDSNLARSSQGKTEFPNFHFLKLVFCKFYNCFLLHHKVECIHVFSGDPPISFEDLQKAIDAEQWKRDDALLFWIFDKYCSLLIAKKTPPPDFGSTAYWNRFNYLLDIPTRSFGNQEGTFKNYVHI